MTEDHARKEAIRRRMQVTGEKYTEARRALAGEDGGRLRYPWFYPPFWEGLGELSDQIRRDEGDTAP